MHSLLYVLPSDPHTGSYILSHCRSHTHSTTPLRSLQVAWGCKHVLKLQAFGGGAGKKTLQSFLTCSQEIGEKKVYFYKESDMALSMKGAISLTVAACNFQELPDKIDISDFSIFCQEKPFGKLLTKIAIKVSKEFLFLRNTEKCEMPCSCSRRH